MGKKICLVIGLMFVLVSGLSAQMTRSQLQQMYVTYLREEGYRPSVDEDGDVRFKYEGYPFYILVNEEDLELFTMVYLNFWEIESVSERGEALVVASDVNNMLQMVKVCVGDYNVAVRAQSFLATPDDFKLFFNRMLLLMVAAAKGFVEGML
jgi:hypothetical protein